MTDDIKLGTLTIEQSLEALRKGGEAMKILNGADDIFQLAREVVEVEDDDVAAKRLAVEVVRLRERNAKLEAEWLDSNIRETKQMNEALRADNANYKADRDALQAKLEAMTEAVEFAFREGFGAGFLEAGEGWNGEYPFGQGRADRDDIERLANNTTAAWQVFVDANPHVGKEP